jgi:hypothetical protein
MALETDAFQNLRVTILDHLGNPITGSGGAGFKMEGTVAHDAPDTGGPLKVGGYASATLPAAVSDGDRTNASFTLEGLLRVIDYGAKSPAQDCIALGAAEDSAGSLETHLSDALVATAVAVKAGGGRLHQIYLYNPNAFVVWLHFYDVAAAGVTVGTTPRKYTFPIPASFAGALFISPVPIGFATAIAIAATKTAATGNAVPDVGLGVFIGYK